MLYLGTHDLQDLKVHIIDELCLKFVIVNGAELSTVYLILECNNRDVEAYEVSRPNDTLVFTQCLSNIPSNNWTLYACDGDPLQDVSTCTSNPAVRLYGIVITPSSSSTGMSSNIISEWTESTFLTSVSSGKLLYPTFKHFLKTYSKCSNIYNANIPILSLSKFGTHCWYYCWSCSTSTFVHYLC